MRGNDDAPVTIVEFADFECPYCGAVQPTLAALDEEYGGEIRWVFKHLPLAIHSRAYAAAIAAQCAAYQDRFWEMADLVFAHQNDLSDSTFTSIVGQLELDIDLWEDCYENSLPRDRVGADVALARQAGVRGTPTFLVNDIPVVGAVPQADFEDAIDEARVRAAASGMRAEDYYAWLVENGCS